jgi:O-antigen/teichoic acid export membrane protein
MPDIKNINDLGSAENIASTPIGAARLTSGSLLARNATLNLAAEGWIFLVLLVAMPKLVLFLGVTQFGLFSLAWVVIGYLAFLDVGVNRAATKYVSEHLVEQDHDSTRLIVRTALTANLALGLAGGIVVILASPYLIHSVFKVSPNLQSQARLTFYAVGVAVPVLLVQGVFRAVLSSYQRFGWINAVNALTTTAQWGTAAVLAWKGHGVALVVFSTVAARILATVAYGAVLFRLLPDLHLFRIHGMHGLPKLLRFGSWVSVSQLVSPLLVYLDRVLIASFVSLAAVTLYTVPFEVITRLRIIPTSLVNTLYPAFSERGMAGQEAQLQRLYEGSMRYLLIMLLPGILFLFMFGSDLLSLWMGTIFALQTSWILQILSVGVLLNCMANIPYYALQALGRPDITGKLHLGEVPFYVVLCVILIPRFGIVGAALASSIRISLDAVLLFWALHKYCRCSLGTLWARAFPIILALNAMLALAFLWIHFTLNATWMRLGAAALTIPLYFLAVWLFLLNKRNKTRIDDVWRLLRGQPAS